MSTPGFLDDFLAERSPKLSTGVSCPPFAVRFECTSPTGMRTFSVTFADGEAVTEVPGLEVVDHTISLDESELRALTDRKAEMIGPFSAAHLPLAKIVWAPALYAYIYPNHEYLGLTPALQELYLDPQYYPTITPFTQGYILYQLAADHGIENTLETGLAFGGSALFFLSAHAARGSGRHVSLDPFQDEFFAGRGLDLIRRSGLAGHLDFRPVRSQEGMRTLVREGEKFGLIYIDGDHRIATVLTDFLNANDLLTDGGFLAFDDSHFPSGRRVLAMIADDFGYEVLPERSTDRLTVLRKTTHHTASPALRARVAVGNAAIPLMEAAVRVRRKVAPRLTLRPRRF